MSEKHYYEQRAHALSYLIPFFTRHLPELGKSKVLEVGCAEAGFLAALRQSGITDAAGLELDPVRAEFASQKNPDLQVIVGDIADARIVERVAGAFDLIVMRDVIEHIPDRTGAFRNLDRLLARGGHLYVTFPPRYSAFAGHQQHARSILRSIPFLHLLPKAMIRTLASMLRESPELAENVIANYRVGLSIRCFERYCHLFDFEPVVRELFLVRPIYRTRFGLRPRRLPNIPLLREVAALGCEYLMRKRT